MDRRCLFVEASQLADVRMDGPALRLRAHGRSLQWFPLRRISRVLCLEVPERSMAVWIDVAAQGIPVLFVRPNGKVLAQLVFPGAEPTDLNHWMGAVLADTEVSQAYDEWLDNWLRHSYGLLGAMSYDRQHAALKADAQVVKLAKQRGIRITATTRQWCHTLVGSQILEQAVAIGLPLAGMAVKQLQADLAHAAEVLAIASVCRTLESDHTLSDGVGFARFYQRRVEPDVQAWLQRALYSLNESLERAALYLSSAPVRAQ